MVVARETVIAVILLPSLPNEENNVPTQAELGRGECNGLIRLVCRCCKHDIGAAKVT